MVDRASRLRRPCRRSLLSSDAPVPAATSRPTPPAGAPPLDSRILPPRAQVRILGSQCRSSPATAAKVPSRLVARGAPSPCGRRRRQPLPLHWRRPRLRAGELKRCDAPLLAGASASKRVPTGCTKGRFLTSLCCTGKNAVFVRHRTVMASGTGTEVWWRLYVRSNKQGNLVSDNHQRETELRTAR